jgi:hypothetical protein
LRPSITCGPGADAPLDFVPKGWRDDVQAGDGPVETKAYALCLADRMRASYGGNWVMTR